MSFSSTPHSRTFAPSCKLKCIRTNPSAQNTAKVILVAAAAGLNRHQRLRSASRSLVDTACATRGRGEALYKRRARGKGIG